MEKRFHVSCEPARVLNEHEMAVVRIDKEARVGQGVSEIPLWRFGGLIVATASNDQYGRSDFGGSLKTIVP